ncbi:MAG: putative metal-binding motif-containing protein, partial [Candidatus Gracilibacteria bacterium]
GPSSTTYGSLSDTTPFGLYNVTTTTDLDSDGYDSIADGGADCDDTNASIYPGATETYYDGIDQNCDGLSDYDADVDGYNSSTYGGTDCDDTNTSIHPGATETWYDGIDQDCSGTSDWDADGDGYDSAIYRGEAMYLISTVKAGGTVESDTYVCNDLNAGVNPDAEEICTDGIDNNCDTLTDSEDIGACPTDTGDDTGDTGDSDADTDADADTDTDTDADSDTDTDADSDADTDSDSDADTDTGGESCTPEVLDGETAPLNCDIICFDEPECDVFIYGVKEGPYTYTLDDGSVTLIPTGDGSLGMGLSDQLDADNLETAKPIGEIFDLGGAEAAAIFFSDAKTSIEKGIFTLEMVDTSKFGIYKNISLGSPDTPINSNNFGDFFKVEKGATIITEDGRPQEGTTAKEILNVCQENPNACAEELTKPTEEPKVCGCSSTPKESPNDLWGLGGLGLTLGLATMRRRKKIIELGENPYPSSPDSADKS